MAACQLSDTSIWLTKPTYIQISSFTVDLDLYWFPKYPSHSQILSDFLLKKWLMAQARKADLRTIPEQVILSEVRRMVEQMQALNRQLVETEATIEEYFKPIDKSAEIIMNMQLQKDEMQAKEMLKVMQEQAMIQREMAQKKLEVNSTNVSQPAPEKESMPSNQEHLK
ncbi:uncharacterized protein LOC103995884 isoform X1 [Musa acuminata AAA Group]|uniref:uncharacterized protein LOC103995884 isoform X1 n=1 Tax=Musa acuminata AAA Group TaxID=214697 RepID=UPI0031DABB1C